MDQTSLTCVTHKQPVVGLQFTQNKSEQVMKCVLCFVQENISGENIICLPELFDSSNSKISITERLLEKELSLKLQKISSSIKQNTTSKIRQSIISFFSSLQDEIINEINNKIKEELKKVDEIELKQNQVIELVNVNNSIINILKVNSSNNNKLNSELTSYFNSMKNSTATSEIKCNILNLEKDLNSFNENQGIESKSKIISIIKQINFLTIEKQIQTFNEGELLNVDFINSSLENCQQAIIQKDENGMISIKTGNQSKYIQVYSNFKLLHNQKYLIQVKIINDSKKNYQLVGLLRQDLKDSNHMYSLFQTFHNDHDGGLKTVKKGDLFKNSLRGKGEFRLQLMIFLEESTFIVYDFPEKNNICQLTQPIDKNKEYCLGAQLYYPNDQIIIESIKTVSSFPSLE